MKWIGLTGGIATGKTTVKKHIESLGLPVVDADEISHLLTQPFELGYQKILTNFGPDYFLKDQSLDRRKLAELIFKNPEKKILLESILHPLIRDRVQQRRKYLAQAGHKFCFYDVPLLFEKNMQSDFDKIVLVWCDEASQLTRLMKRNSFTVEQAQSRIQNQLDFSIKIKNSHSCIDNSTSVSSLVIQLNHLVSRLKSEYAA